MKIYKSLIILLSISSFTLLWKNKLKFDEKYVIQLDKLCCDFKIINKRILNIKNSYINIELYNSINWKNNSEDFWKVIIANKKNKKFEFSDFTIWECWDKNFQNFSEIKNKHFLYLNLGEGRYVVALKGSMSSSHNQGCPILTLILANEEEPKVIFNTHVRLLEIIKNDDNSCKLRVRFGRYEYNEQSVTDAKGRLVPCNFDDVYVCDLYVRNNELVVEKLPYTRQEVYETFTEEEIEASYN